MADWPLYDGQGAETVGVTSASSIGVAVTSAGTINTKGSWTEIIAATSSDATGMIVNIGRGHTQTADFLVDIGIGGSGSETVLIPNLKADNGTSLLGPGQIIIPIGVPAGSRLSARCQATAASAVSRIQVLLQRGSWLGQPPLSRVTDYGTVTGDSGATSIDPTTTANTKGLWAQIAASTANPMRAMLVAIGNVANSNRSAGDWLVDIGIGGSGSEVVIIADWHIEASTSDDVIYPRYLGPIGVNIPAGTRLAARAQSTTMADSADRLFDLAIYGID
ncbi:hypothetical protein [Herbidospora sp. RD11066]